MGINAFQTEAAMIQDAVRVFTNAFGNNETFIEQYEMNPMSCEEINKYPNSNSGRDILNKVDEVISFNIYLFIH